MNRMMFWLNTVFEGFIDILIETFGLSLGTGVENGDPVTATATATGGNVPLSYSITFEQVDRHDSTVSSGVSSNETGEFSLNTVAVRDTVSDDINEKFYSYGPSILTATATVTDAGGETLSSTSSVLVEATGSILGLPFAVIDPDYFQTDPFYLDGPVVAYDLDYVTFRVSLTPDRIGPSFNLPVTVTASLPGTTSTISLTFNSNYIPYMYSATAAIAIPDGTWSTLITAVDACGNTSTAMTIVYANNAPRYYMCDTFSTDDAAPLTSPRNADVGPGVMTMHRSGGAGANTWKTSGGALYWDNADAWNQHAQWDGIAVTTGMTMEYALLFNNANRQNNFNAGCYDNTNTARDGNAFLVACYDDVRYVNWNGYHQRCDNMWNEPGRNYGKGWTSNEFWFMTFREQGAAVFHASRNVSQMFDPYCVWFTREPWSGGSTIYPTFNQGNHANTASLLWADVYGYPNVGNAGNFTPVDFVLSPVYSVKKEPWLRHSTWFDEYNEDTPVTSITGRIVYSVSAPWSKNSGADATVSNGELLIVGDSNANLCWVPVGVNMAADNPGLILSARTKWSSGANVGFAFQVLDEDNFCFAQIIPSTGAWYIGKFVAGVWSSITSGNWGAITQRTDGNLMTFRTEVVDQTPYWVLMMQHPTDPYKSRFEYTPAQSIHPAGTGAGVINFGNADARYMEFEAAPSRNVDYYKRHGYSDGEPVGNP